MIVRHFTSESWTAARKLCDHAWKQQVGERYFDAFIPLAYARTLLQATGWRAHQKNITFGDCRVEKQER